MPIGLLHLPGQYVMTNPICDTYESYTEATLTAVAFVMVAAATTAGMLRDSTYVKQHTLLPVVTIVTSCR